MRSWLLSLGSVGVVSLVSLAGLVTLSLNETGTRRLAALLVSFAVGALLGDAFIHLIPQTFKQDPVTLRPSLLILGGMLLFFVVEKLLRHEHGLLHKQHHPEVSSVRSWPRSTCLVTRFTTSSTAS
jgi:zinc and cadmium transporter